MSMSDRQWNWMVAKTMEKFGGGFLQALSRAYFHADEDNARRIREAFPEYWGEYRSIAEHYVEAEGPDWWDKPL